MAPPVAKKVGEIIIKEIGKRLSKLAAKKAGARFIGHMARGSRAWAKAFKHIRAHFRHVKGKASHAIFKKKFRNEAALKGLIRQAISNPSRSPVLTKLTVGAQNLGRPAVVLERQFKNAIGNIGDEACHILRVIIDYTGRPITAYPVKEFLKKGGGKAAGAAAGGAAVAGAQPAHAASPVDIYAELIAAERAEQQERIDERCEPDGIAEWVFDFLLSPSCIAPDPHELISIKEVNQRVEALIRVFERKIGGKLDRETRANVRVDVIAAWNMGYRME